MTEYDDLLARAGEFLTPAPVEVAESPTAAIAAAGLLVEASVPPVPVLDDRDVLLTRAAEFLREPMPVSDPGPVIASEGLTRAEAEPFLVDGVPALPVHPPVVVDDGGVETQADDETGEES